jgi:hypothetical protein
MRQRRWPEAWTAIGSPGALRARAVCSGSCRERQKRVRSCVLVPAPAGGSSLALALVFALGCTGTACGRSVRPRPAGAVGAGGGGTVVVVGADGPLEARHVTVGAPVSTGCLSSVVPTATGLRYAGRGNSAPFAGTGEPDPRSGWSFTNVASPNEASGSAVVFGDASGQVVAWPSNAVSGISFSLFDADGGPLDGLQTDAQGEPLAAVGTVAEFSLAFSYASNLSVMHVRNGVAVVTPVESDGCVEPTSVAIGAFEEDAVVGYFCNRFSQSGAAQHLVYARVKLATDGVERAVLDVAVGAPTMAGIAATGVPAAFWHGDELLFAHPTAEGALALTRVKASDRTVSTGVVTGIPSTDLRANEKNPVFSVVQVGDQVGLTRGVCNRREDAEPTGAFDLCRISTATLAAVCSEVEAPCQAAKLVASGSAVTLLGCSFESPTLVPLDLAAIPARQPGFFPSGYSSFEPLSLTCEGDACSALLELSSSRMVTGHDARLAFADLDLAAGCTAATCRASSLEPTALFTEASDDPSYTPSLTLQRQITGLPLAVVTLDRDEQGLNYLPQLSLLERTGVRWTQPVTSSAAAVFAQGDGFLGLWSDFSPGVVHQYSVSASGTVSGPDLALRSGGSGLPRMALCNGRILVHGLTQDIEGPPLEPVILGYEPQTGAVTALFHPAFAPADAENPSRSIGCAGDRVLMLDGLWVHQFSLSGERGPDVELATPPSVSLTDPVFTQLETRSDHVLVASSGRSKNVLDVLLFYADGTNRAYELPLAPNAAPVVALAVAPDRGDGWLRLLYQSGQETVYALRRGYVYASGYKLFE